MKTGTVHTILGAYKEGMPLDHTVDINTKITYAIEQMVKNNLKNIVVLKEGKPVGTVCLNDALKHVGLSINAMGE